MVTAPLAAPRAESALIFTVPLPPNKAPIQVPPV